MSKAAIKLATLLSESYPGSEPRIFEDEISIYVRDNEQYRELMKKARAITVIHNLRPPFNFVVTNAADIKSYAVQDVMGFTITADCRIVDLNGVAICV